MLFLIRLLKKQGPLHRLHHYQRPEHTFGYSTLNTSPVSLSAVEI